MVPTAVAGRRSATRLGASLLLLAALVLPVPAASAGEAIPGPVVPRAVTDADAGPSEALGFWLGPPDAEALRRQATLESGLPIGADGEPRILSLADARSWRAAAIAVHERANGALTSRFRVAAAALGVTSFGVMTSAPLVVARVTPAQAAALAASPMVAAVQPSGGVELQMATAYPTIGAPAAYQAGHRANGVRVAVVEYARIDFGVAALRDVPRQKLRVARTDDGLDCRSGDPRTPDPSTSHMTRVAAIIGGRSSRAPRGVAPGATLVQASIDLLAYDNLETAARVVKAIECAITQGDADVINLSLSEPRRDGYVRAYLDHLVSTYGVFVAAAAGNAVYGTCPDGRALSPSTAWNVLSVGGTSDAGTRRRDDDTLWTENGRNAVCTGDPAGQAGDRDRRIKPEISAVARNVEAAGYGPSSGTSYATPMVSGAAATLIGRDPALATRPHVVKAVLVAASRVHRTRTPRGSISTDREGAGSLSVEWAHRILAGGTSGLPDAGGYGERIVGSDPGAADCRKGANLSFWIPGHAGRQVRIVITWLSHARKPSLTGDPVNRRKSDLDLVVRRPGGAAIGGASSSRTGLDASNLEWLDFRAPVTGTYRVTIVVDRWDCDLVAERVGFAWVAYRD